MVGSRKIGMPPWTINRLLPTTRSDVASTAKRHNIGGKKKKTAKSFCRSCMHLNTLTCKFWKLYNFVNQRWFIFSHVFPFFFSFYFLKWWTREDLNSTTHGGVRYGTTARLHQQSLFYFLFLIFQTYTCINIAWRSVWIQIWTH